MESLVHVKLAKYMTILAYSDCKDVSNGYITHSEIGGCTFLSPTDCENTSTAKCLPEPKCTSVGGCK